MGDLRELQNELRRRKNPAKAILLRGFFKTGPGEYGEGDVFFGLTVPQSRKIAKKFPELDLAAVRKLLSSAIHEGRLIALLILVARFQRAGEKERKKITQFYLRNLRRVNNWDLVDLSAPRILGEYLLKRPKAVLYRLVASKNLWERRIAVLATFRFIAGGRFTESLVLARLLLSDRHDLIHKAVGWMLREVGKRDKAAEVRFLNKYCKVMPRTMLRYAIEKFPKGEQREYLKK